MLPTCPACKQSVLDDDAEECPFCGANMKTGKAGKSKPPAGAAPAKPASKPSATESKPPASTSKPKSGRLASTFDDDDDDPFAAGEDDPFTAAAKEEAANKAKAIAVSPKKGKINTIEIKCPMCETVGFVPEAAAGKDVKCYNPKCSMPNFMAPKRFAAPLPATPVKEPKKKKESDPNSKMPLILTLVGGICLCGIVGGVYYMWPEDKGPDKPTFPPLGGPTRPTNSGSKDPGGEIDPNEPPEQGPAKAVAAVAPQGPDLDELLNRMTLLSSEEPILQNKLKCRRLVAIAYAATNNVAGLDAQLQALDKLDARQPALKIPGMLALAWNQLESGDKASALKSVQQALATPGNSSRETQEPTLDLASLMVALGQQKEARDLLATKLPVDQNTPLAVMMSVARHRKDFDLTQELPGTTPQFERAWSSLGVTLILAARGHWNESLQWAESVPDLEAKTDCLLAWADARTRAALAAKTAVDPSVEALVTKFTPEGKTQLLGRLALTHAVAGNKAEAERLTTAALEALKAITVPPAPKCDTFKEVLDWNPPAVLPLRQAVLGAALIGQAQGKLNHPDEGWKTILEALKLARAMAPSPASVASVKRSADDLGITNLRMQIRMLLKLRTNDEAVKRTSDLTENLRHLNVESAMRYELQEVVLIRAVHAGMAVQVWKEVLSLSQRSDPNQMEPFITGTLANHLLHQLEKEGKQTELGEVKEKVGSLELPFDEAFEMEKLIEASLTRDHFKEIADFTNQHKLSSPAEALVLGSFIAASKTPELGVESLSVVSKLDLKASSQLNLIKLEGLRMTAAHAARNGKALEVRNLIQSQGLGPLERIAGYLGLIEGHTVWQKEHPATVPATAPADPGAKPAA